MFVSCQRGTRPQSRNATTNKQGLLTLFSNHRHLLLSVILVQVVQVLQNHAAEVLDTLTEPIRSVFGHGEVPRESLYAACALFARCARELVEQETEPAKLLHLLVAYLVEARQLVAVLFEGEEFEELEDLLLKLKDAYQRPHDRVPAAITWPHGFQEADEDYGVDDEDNGEGHGRVVVGVFVIGLDEGLSSRLEPRNLGLGNRKPGVLRSGRHLYIVCREGNVVSQALDEMLWG